ncbi:MAG: hypothetical protein HDS24_05940 [Bacteroides sp.]|nr:hypothetical protein [Bacteroides sp.]
MEKEQMIVAVYGSRHQDKNAGKLLEMFSMLRRQGMRVLVEERLGNHLHELGIAFGDGLEIVKEFPREAMTLVSIGGDGTFLRASRWAGGSEVGIIGLNTGHLGFLASYALDEVGELVEIICRRCGVVEPRLALRLEGHEEKTEGWPYALNEIAVSKSVTASMLNVRTYVDGEFLADYRADGLVISTPTGSTAYNLSVGGPILEPTLRSVILSPNAPHSLTMRPLVISADSRIDLEVYSRVGECHLALDGRTFDMACRDTRLMSSEGEAERCGEAGIASDLRISAAPFSVNVLRRPDSNYARLLRNKLLWGRR